jgi:hypothetical protein
MMRHMAIIFALAALCPLAAGFSASPDFIGMQDTGNENYPTLDVGISIDCESKEITVSAASHDEGSPVEGAKAYLFYTDYTYQALPNPGTTDADGTATMSVPGTLKFLTAMFTLRVDKQGFRSREIEFSYEKCFEAPPEDEAGGGEAGGDDAAAVEEDEDAYGSLDEAVADDTPAPVETPETAPPAGGEAAGDDGAGQPETPEPAGGACPAGMLLAALLFARMRA